MGSKHSPPRWWQPTLEEECARYDAECARVRLLNQTKAQLEYLGKGMEIDPFHILIPKGDPPKITWVSYEEVGAQCLTVDGEPITPNMVTHIGMEILCPTLFETYARATITSETRAESEHSIFNLLHDPVRGLVSDMQLNKAVLKLELLP